MLKYKMVVTDYDDTLLRNDNTISAHTVRVVDKFIADGGIFTIATGRMYEAVASQLNKINVNAPIIACQGAYIVDSVTGEIVSKQVTTSKQAGEILKFFEDNGIYVQIYADDVMYVQRHTEETFNYERICSIQAKDTESKLSEWVVENNIEPNKILAMTPADETRAVVAKLKCKFDYVGINITKPTFIEVVNINATKAFGIDMLAKERGLSSSDVIAIGDSMNDISMIKYAGLGVCVANAIPELKQLAQVVVPSNDQDGVAYLIEKYCY